MKLYYLNNCRLPTEKANGHQIMNMCAAFSKIGVNTCLVYPFRLQGDQSLQVSPFAYYNVDESFALEMITRFDWLRYATNLNRRLHRTGARIQMLYFAFAVLAYTQPHWENPANVFYSRDRFCILALLLFRNFIKGKIAFEAHAFPERRRNIVVKMLKRLDKLICTTAQMKKMFIESGMDERAVIVEHDAVDLQKFNISESSTECRKMLGLPVNRKIIGYVGRFQTMGMEKGIPELISSMKYLVDGAPENPPLLLCVGGPLTGVSGYWEIAREKGVSRQHLKFVDRIPSNEVPFWIKACDVMTMIFPWNRHMAYYASPMKLFEYMAVGTPIVASNLPSTKEILRHDVNALLVEPHNIEAIALCIQEILYNGDRARCLARQAWEDVQSHTWHARARRIMSSLDGASSAWKAQPA